MAVTTRPVENRIVAHTSWDGYLRCREALDGSNVKITYDEGWMELMSPSKEHENSKSDLGEMLSAYLQEMQIDYGVGGGPTMKMPPFKGLEPDDCFYLRENAMRRRADPPLGQTVYPPDLVLEIEVSCSALDRLDIFRHLGIREVWRYIYEERRIVVHHLGPDGTYQERTDSQLLPDLPLSGLAYFVQRGDRESTGRMVAAFRAWLRDGRPSLEHPL